jgi:hypothetical protein
VLHDRAQPLPDRIAAAAGWWARPIEVAAEAEAVTPAAANDADDRVQLLRELVDTLPERYRRTLTLFYYEERSVPEVAAMLGLPEGTVKTNLFRARGLLLGSLEQLGLADANLWREMAAGTESVRLQARRHPRRCRAVARSMQRWPAHCSRWAPRRRSANGCAPR